MVTCPLCEGDRTTVVDRFTASDAAQHFVTKQENPDRHDALRASIRALWSGDSAENRECADCSFGFASPYVAGDAGFYELAFGVSGYPRDKWEFDKTLDALTTLNPVDAPILEIGAGRGHFLEKISPRFYEPSNVTALEYNADSIRRLAAKGYDASSRNFRDLAADNRKYSAIFMFQVLEHIDDVRGTFAALFRLLAPQGNLFIAVPNPGRVRFNEENGSLHDMPPNHIGRWTKASFERAADDSGLTIVDYASEPSTLASFVKQDVYYAHKRKAQLEGTAANRLAGVRHTAAGRVLNIATMTASSALRIPTWIKASRVMATLGDTNWVHLRRTGSAL